MFMSPLTMTTAAVLFDLDGTLLDTLEDIASAVNAVLEHEGFPAHPAAAYRQFIGDGAPMLFRPALPEGKAPPELIARCLSRFQDAYGQCWNIRTRPYEGVPELLDELTRRGLALAVLSNKPDEFTQRCVEHYFSAWPIRAVIGQRADLPRKPDPAGAWEISRRLGISPEAFLYLGDSSVDMKTARSAGMRSIGASWGFRSVDELRSNGAEVIIDHPSELIAVLAG